LTLHCWFVKCKIKINSSAKWVRARNLVKMSFFLFFIFWKINQCYFTNTKVFFMLLYDWCAFQLNHIYLSIVLRSRYDGLGIRSIRWLDRFGFNKRPAVATARPNPGDPGEPERDPVFFLFSNVGFEIH
jgi:hypothetical protein